MTSQATTLSWIRDVHLNFLEVWSQGQGSEETDSNKWLTFFWLPFEITLMLICIVAVLLPKLKIRITVVSTITRELKGRQKVSNLSQRMTKPIKWNVRPAKTMISLGIRPVWSESSLSARRKLGSWATHGADSEDSDQTGRMPRPIWVYAGRIKMYFLFYLFFLSLFFRLCLRGLPGLLENDDCQTTESYFSISIETCK